LKITGSISASNYIVVPDIAGGIKSLGLVGKYVKIKIKK
jgi:hypothetical protein